MSRGSSSSENWQAIRSGAEIEGRIRPPASKSLTQRFLNLALLSTGRTELIRPLVAEDTSLFLAALGDIGMSVDSGPSETSVEPKSEVRECEIRCGNNGTMLRFLLGSLSTRPGIWVVDGSPRLRQRPVGPLVTALRQLGARIDYLGLEGFAPLRVHGGELGEGRVLLDAGTSSQFASSILMAATRARGEVVVELTDLTSASYLDLTVASMSQFGAHTESLDSHRLKVRPSAMTGGRYSVEPDFSAAAYPAVAALLTGGSVMLEGLSASSKQGDLQFLELVGRIGADVEWTGDGVLVRGRSEISGIEVDLSTMPDQVPTLAALAPFAHGRTTIRNVAHLRYKESDRLDAMCRELTRLGADVEEREDGLVIDGTWAEQSPPDTNVRVRTYGDHRIAMSLALVGLRRPGVEISEPEVVTKSYPDFWRDLESLIAK